MCLPRLLGLCSEERAWALPEFTAQFDTKVQQARSQLMLQGRNKLPVDLGRCRTLTTASITSPRTVLGRSGSLGWPGSERLPCAAPAPPAQCLVWFVHAGIEKNTPKDAPRREGMQLLSREDGKWVHLLVLTSAPFRFPTYLIVCDFGVDYSRSFVC